MLTRVNQLHAVEHAELSRREAVSLVQGRCSITHDTRNLYAWSTPSLQSVLTTSREVNEIIGVHYWARKHRITIQTTCDVDFLRTLTVIVVPSSVILVWGDFRKPTTYYAFRGFSPNQLKK